MGFDWGDFYRLAEELSRCDPEDPLLEAKLRSAVSRAYYAALSLGRQYIEDFDDSIELPTDAKIHREVGDWFKNRRDNLSRTVSTNLSRLRGGRSRADYDDVLSGPRETAELAVKQASKVATCIGELRKKAKSC